VLERSLASCVRSHDISSSEADAPWPRLTPLGDTSLHQPTCVFTIRRYDGVRFFSSYVRGNASEIKSVHGAQIACKSKFAARERAIRIGISRRLLLFIVFFVTSATELE